MTRQQESGAFLFLSDVWRSGEKGGKVERHARTTVFSWPTAARERRNL